MDRNYMVRGADRKMFLPSDFLSKPELSTLVPLPHEDNPIKPTSTHLTDGANDDDGDGEPGILYQISGSAGGTRSVVQRDWNEYSMLAPIPTNAIEFVARCDFDNQENILHVAQCPPLGCKLLLAGSHHAQDHTDRVTFRYLGKNLSDPRVKAVIVGELKGGQAANGSDGGSGPDGGNARDGGLGSKDRDMQTCVNVRAALPHDPRKQ